MLAAIWAARESGPLPVVEAPPPTDGVPSTNEDAAVLHGRSVAALAGEEASAVRGGGVGTGAASCRENVT